MLAGLASMGLGATLVDQIESARAAQIAVTQNLQAASAASQAGDLAGAGRFRGDAAAASLSASRNVAALADARREQLQRESAAMAAGQPPASANRQWLLTWGALGVAAVVGGYLLLRKKRGR